MSSIGVRIIGIVGERVGRLQHVPDGVDELRRGARIGLGKPLVGIFARGKADAELEGLRHQDQLVAKRDHDVGALDRTSTSANLAT
jgi:hypothetical protein